MKHIDLKTNPILWFVFITSFFVFASTVLLFVYGSDDLMLVLFIAMVSTSLINSILLVVHTMYNPRVIFTDSEIKIFGTPSTGIPYNEIQKIRVNISGFSIFGKTNKPIRVTNLSTNFNDAKKLLKEKIQNQNEISFEGSNWLIHKHFVKEE